MKALVRCRLGWVVAAMLVAVLALGAGAVEAGTVYVSTAGDDVHDGLTWATAKATVQAGLNAAVSGDEVWVAAGTYVGCITLKADVALYGGFAGGETDLSQRNWTVNVAELDGNQAGSVVTAPEGAIEATRIDGFTIRNGTGTIQAGWWRAGGGILCSSSSPTIANNTITGNNVPGVSIGSYGGGIDSVDGSPTIVNNTISGNTACNGGGGIYCSGGSPTIRNNTVKDNWATNAPGSGYGGGICCYSSATITNNTITGNWADMAGGGIACISAISVTIEGNVLADNSAPSGGGVYTSASTGSIAGNTIRDNGASTGGGIYCEYPPSGMITNNTIAGNKAWYGGGIGCYSLASPMIANNTITGNFAPGAGGGIHCGSSSWPTIMNNTIVNNAAASGGGVACESNSAPGIVNTIIAFNSSGISNTSGWGGPSVRLCCVYGNGEYNYAGVFATVMPGTNLSIDPKLAGVVYGNFHIQPDSPCVDAGDSPAVQVDGKDMDGQARQQGAGLDIGADESDGTVWSPGPYVIVRISPNGDDSHDGSSWGQAKRTVQAGIDAAANLRGDVWVAAGTYVERVTLRNYVHVYGGFAGTETQRSERNWTAHATILDGDQTGSVVTARYVGKGLSAIDGFTIRNGKAEVFGGGIYCGAYASPTIANNTITGNTAFAAGGGIYCTNHASPTIANSRIVGNTALDGGGVYCDSSAPTIVNTAIMRNSGSGVDCSYSSPVLLSCTITGNAASYGAGIGCYDSSPTVANSIIAFNTSGVEVSGQSTPVLRYNCTYLNNAYDYSGLADPTGTNGNISADPLLVQRLASRGPDGKWGTADDDYGDLHVLPGSPCIDAGNNTDVPADSADLNGNGDTAEPLPVDLAGASRFADDPYKPDTGAGTAPIVDMGVYEHHLADINGDGHIDVADLLYLVDAFGTYGGDAAYDARCDFNRDGAIDVVDLLDLVYNFGE